MATDAIPSSMKQIFVKKLTTNFREGTAIDEVPVPKPGPEDVLVKNSYVGINASDINVSAGRYNPSAKPPFPCGGEAIGTVVDVGDKATVKKGQVVVYLQHGAFAQYTVVPAAKVIPVPSIDPAFISLVVSGLTASISLEKEADLKEGKTVLVTAAAGGTGQFAVQIAKLAGCHVIGTCSSQSKVDFLKSIGCDRPINYKEEDLDTVLSKEYPKGVDVVYECIGQKIFDAAMKNLAVNGRLIVIGMISGYHHEDGIQNGGTVSCPLLCLRKSASIRGFFLLHYQTEVPRHAMLLTKQFLSGAIKAKVDNGEAAKPFKGLEGVYDAIDYMYSGKNVGKVVVSL